MEILQDTRLNVRLLAGATNGSTIPGDCLEAASIPLSKSPARWVELPLAVPIRSPGWHFLEIEGNADVVPYLLENAPVGVLRDAMEDPSGTGIDGEDRLAIGTFHLEQAIGSI